MKNKKIIVILCLFIIVLALVATLAGILTSRNSSGFEYISIYGKTVKIFGTGIYSNMSEISAVDGISQDFITLILAIPLLIWSLIMFLKNKKRGELILAGVLLYFLFTYLVYLVTAMFNEMYLVYTALISLSFFALALTIIRIDINSIKEYVDNKIPIKTIGIFLIVFPLMVAFMWIGRIVPYLTSHIIPEGLDHYTTLTVQGLDLSLMHPLCIFSGVLLIRRNKWGYLLSPIFLVFLSIMMTAIGTKVIGEIIILNNEGLVIAAIFYLAAIISAILSYKYFKNVNDKPSVT